jgi:hypothetical protein
MGFTKLFDSLVYSTIWREDKHTKIVWITMLAIANQHGEVLVSVPGLADAARVSLEECRDALAILKAPDPDSRTTTNEGRRIEHIDGGFLILNYQKYRAIRSEDDRRTQVRQAVQRHRAKNSAVITRNPSKPRKAQAEAEAEAVRTKEKGAAPPKEKRTQSARSPAQMATPSNNDDNNSHGKALLIVAQLRRLKELNRTSGLHVIAQDSVQRLAARYGPDAPHILAAYEAVGMDDILNGKKSFVARDFDKALRASRQQLSLLTDSDTNA